MSRSTKNNKIKYNSIRYSKSDYIKYFLAQKASILAIGTLCFLAGSIFFANIDAVKANTPTANPPGGNVDGRFRNMIITGSIHDRPGLVRTDVAWAKYLFGLNAGEIFRIRGPLTVDPNNSQTWGTLQLQNTLLQAHRIVSGGGEGNRIQIGNEDHTNRADGVAILGHAHRTIIGNNGISRVNLSGNLVPLAIRASSVTVPNGKIGNYYTASRTISFPSSRSSGEGLVTATCPAGQIISCEAHANGPSASTRIHQKTLIDSSNGCGVAYVDAFRVIIEARCFDPAGVQSSVNVIR